MKVERIRQPIITVAGHVDHGKTSLLDCFRGSCVQEGEAGGISQKISFTCFPSENIKNACHLIDENNIELEIPGFMFIDTPGHAAFTNLRKRGGALADLAILVMDINEGIKPQTAEVIQILKHNKTPFVIALNKIDNISGWRTAKKGESLKDSIESQPEHVKEQFTEKYYTIIGSLSSYGFEAELYYKVNDFTKQVAMVPCSARTKEGIPELLMMLCGLSQKFLKGRLVLGDVAKGVILESKKDRTTDYFELILYDGELNSGDEIAIASFGELIVTKIRTLEELQPMTQKYKTVEKIVAATGARVQLANKEGVLSGMPFVKVEGDIEQVKENFRKDLAENIKTESEGIIVKADSLGSLEALLLMLRQANVPILKVGIGNINKIDAISAKANLEINPVNSVVIGFNVGVDDDAKEISSKIKFINQKVIFKLVEDLLEFQKNKRQEIEKERLMELAPICKLEILHKYVFRNTKPAIFGVRVLGGKLKQNMFIMADSGGDLDRVKGLQEEKTSLTEAESGKEVALSLQKANYEREIKDKKFLYSDLTPGQFKSFKKNKDLLSSDEIKILQEIADIKRKKDDKWGL